MRFPKKIVAFVGVLFVLTLVAGQEQQPQPLDPALMILRVGSSAVSNGEHVVLQQAITEVFGRAWSYENKEFYALIKFREGKQWYVTSSNKSEPGGVFNIAGVRFPQSGDFELLVTMREPESLAVGKWIDDSQWRNQSLASSNRVLITVEGSPIVEGDSGESEFHLSLVSIANVGMRPREINAVPASADVVLRARGLPGRKFYLAVHVPYTDRCYIVGPAKAIELPNTYLLESVSFTSPGDPQQVHFDVLAFASSQPVRLGPMSWQSLWQSETVSSPTIQIITEGRRPRVDGLRVPFVAITRIGHHVLDTTKPVDRVLQVDQGDLLEVETYERTTEGAMMWALTRTKGSSLWLAQGPLLPRGLPSSAAEDGRPVVVWVLPGLQFQAEGEEELEQPEFEIMTALTNVVFPNSWISTASISAQSIETISKPVPVRVEGYAIRSKHRLSILQVGSQEADAENELTVGTFESVVIERPETLSEPLKIYLGKHVTGTETWSFVEAIPNGKTHFVPAVQFTNPHPREGAQYQILAIATKGPLPAREVEYHDILPHIVMSSEILNVRYSSGFFSSLGTFFQSWFSSDAEPGTQTGGTSIMPWILLLAILTLLLLFASMLWFFRSNPELAGEIADTLQRGHASAKKKFELPESINLPYLLLGLTLLGVIVYVIRNYYISLYTAIVSTTTGLPHKQSSDLALWIILVTALAGIFADIGHKQKKAVSAQQQGASIHEFIFFGSIVIAILLWVFQGLMYSTFLAGTSQKAFLSLAGFGAGLLISITETIAFFIITELTLVPFGWFLLMIILAPFSVGALNFRLMQRVFTRKTPEQNDNKPPPPEPAETAKPPDAVEPPPQDDEV